ncbi:endolytic transglycosylase MltG [Streptomyces sp. CBMA152]|uniref:endolytic transglycosylase MltG n=1 Tax=Streptomyces sp. CBMA152 TaxID=1896312 RepID=UPI0016608A6F|nr:endolytic transglycosylase MltG [Streptomyces sp. CBMA152]MBD0743881.1 aminodeoxychorismate lyase [Streptomyces sp. CBMA152]
MTESTRSAGPRTRLTRRGRLLLAALALMLVAGAVVLVLVLRETGGKVKSLVIPEGWRAGQVYAAVDKSLGVAPGTTRQAASSAGLELPTDANGNPEGYLFPATYPVTKKTTPAGLLAYMVDTANKRFGKDHIAAGAGRNKLTVYQTVVVASIVQAEADTTADMGKVSRVIYNRLAKGMPLQMDSTLNYALNRSTLSTTHADTRTDSPYNTYARDGLPPTPIDNPGQQALNAAIAPPPGDWLYFVTVAPGDTRFTSSYAEQQRNVREFNNHRSKPAG